MAPNSLSWPSYFDRSSILLAHDIRGSVRSEEQIPSILSYIHIPSAWCSVFLYPRELGNVGSRISFTSVVSWVSDDEFLFSQESVYPKAKKLYHRKFVIRKKAIMYLFHLYEFLSQPPFRFRFFRQWRRQILLSWLEGKKNEWSRRLFAKIRSG